MTATDLPTSLIEEMKSAGVDVTTWDPEVYNRLKQEMKETGTSIVYLREPTDNAKFGIRRHGVYVKVLGWGSHVLYPKDFTEHEGCLCPTIFILTRRTDKSGYEVASNFVRNHFGIEPDPGLVCNFPPGIWPDIKVQESIEYPIPFTYEAWPHTVELRPGQFDPTEVLVSKIDDSEWVWVSRPPKQ
jgi:hypothetical protein